MIKACIFDAFGTLFNLDEQLLAHIDHPKVNDILSYAREKQLSYTWIRTLMQEYLPFDELTKLVLKDACHKYNAPVHLIPALSALYFEPVIFEDVLPTLTALKNESATVGILSNGTSAMLQSGITKNALQEYLDVVYSADSIRQFKPAPEVYQLVTNGLNLKAEEVLFVSSNQWDVAGAAKFGMNVAWVNRAGHFRECITDRSNVIPVAALTNVIDFVG